ncbi:type II secretion system F family protein, partial [Patescibacteria group bacterium]|nr:type II secretion system F family protein [Patescibacteria group bacterium]
HDTEKGISFSDAMSRFDDVFDESEIGVIKAGEATGKLHLILFRLSVQLDKRHELNMKIFGASVYPVAVLSVLTLVAIGMLVWVLPSLLSLLSEGGVSSDSLPLATKILLALQSLVVDFWWAILLFVAGLYGLFMAYVSSAKGATRFDYFKLTIPVVGDLFRKIYVLRFVGLLGLLIESGVAVLQALRITGNASTNRVYKLKAQEIVNEVRAGNKISDSMKDSEFLFPSEVVQMIKVGETSANLAQVSEKISAQYQKEVDNSLKKLTTLFEPVMILVVGLLVALMALSIMAPIFNLSQNVSV